jgi:hypothetical protein
MTRADTTRSPDRRGSTPEPQTSAFAEAGYERRILAGAGSDDEFASSSEWAIGALVQQFDTVQRSVDRLTLGVMLVRGRGTVVASNAAARQILAQRDGLFLLNRTLVASRAVDTESLATHISSAVAKNLYLNPPAFVALSVARPSGRTPYMLLVAPFESQDEPGFAPSALVLIEDLERRGSDPAGTPYLV